jgi:hypothetical protein
VVPVVVAPDAADAEPYLAAARLGPSETDITLYDDPDFYNAATPDNPHLGGLREIEVDGDGNVYVINAHRRNISDVLWKYGAEGSVLRRIELSDSSRPRFVPDLTAIEDPNRPVYAPDPVGLCVAADGEIIYVASGQRDTSEPNVAWVYGFSTTDLSLVRQIKLKNIDVVTGMTENPTTGALWVTGFRMFPEDTEAIDEWDEITESFYYERVARVDLLDDDPVYATWIEGSHDLGLPLSIVWTGSN